MFGVCKHWLSGFNVNGVRVKGYFSFTRTLMFEPDNCWQKSLIELIECVGLMTKTNFFRLPEEFLMKKVLESFFTISFLNLNQMLKLERKLSLFSLTLYALTP